MEQSYYAALHIPTATPYIDPFSMLNLYTWNELN